MDVPKVVKLQPEEHEKLLGLQQLWNDLTKRYGELHYQQKSIKTQLELIDGELDSLEEERFKVVDEMEKKYGIGQVNLSTGEFLSDAPTQPEAPQ